MSGKDGGAGTLSRVLGSPREVEVGRGQGSSGLVEVGGGLEGETRGWEGFLSWKDKSFSQSKSARLRGRGEEGQDSRPDKLYGG